MNGGPKHQIQDGTCDGIGFTRESRCCKDHAATVCPHGSGCFDYLGKSTQCSIRFNWEGAAVAKNINTPIT